MRLLGCAARENRIRAFAITNPFQHLRNRQIKRLPRIFWTRRKWTGALWNICDRNTRNRHRHLDANRSHLDCGLGSAGG